MANSIQLIQGKKTSSGSDLVREADTDTHSSGYGSRRYIVVSGVRLSLIPDDLYYAGSSDLLLVVYKRKNNEVVAWWNHTAKKGSSFSILKLIFHPIAVFTVLFGAGVLWYAGRDGGVNGMTKTGINAVAAAAVVLAYLFSYLDWKKMKAANELIQQQKQRLTK